MLEEPQGPSCRDISNQTMLEPEKMTGTGLRPCLVQVGAVWLRGWCARAAGGSGAEAHGDDAVALAVARAVLGAKSGDEAAAQLFDLFGDGAFEAIQELLELRSARLTRAASRGLCLSCDSNWT